MFNLVDFVDRAVDAVDSVDFNKIDRVEVEYFLCTIAFLFTFYSYFYTQNNVLRLSKIYDKQKFV